MEEKRENVQTFATIYFRGEALLIGERTVLYDENANRTEVESRGKSRADIAEAIPLPLARQFDACRLFPSLPFRFSSFLHALSRVFLNFMNSQ